MMYQSQYVETKYFGLLVTVLHMSHTVHTAGVSRLMMQKFNKTLLSSLLCLGPFCVQAATTLDQQTHLDDMASTNALDLEELNALARIFVAEDGSIALGLNTTAQSGNSVAIGSGAMAEGGSFTGYAGTKNYAATAIGADVKATADYATALGANSRATEKSATALGREAMADAEGGIAIGWGAITRAIGDSSSAKNAIALGKQAKAESDNATALGASSTAHGLGSVALGHFAGAYKEGSVAIGADAKSNVKGSIAIGQNALVEAKDIKGADVTSYLTNIVNQDASFGVVSFGQKSTRFNVPDTTRRLTFVAGGIDDTDAANIAQLKVLHGKISNLANEIQGLAVNDAQINLSQSVQRQLENYQQQLDTLNEQYSSLATGQDLDQTQLLQQQDQAIQQTQAKVDELEAHLQTQAETLDTYGEQFAVQATSLADLQATMAESIPALEHDVKQLNHRVDHLNQQVERNRKRADAGVAGAIAIASLPQPTANGRTSVGMAMGFSGGESALSMGAVHNFMQGKASLKVGTSFNSQDKASGGFGLGWTFN